VRRLSLIAVLLAACAGPEPANPVRLTLTNRTGGFVTGALLRFDREIAGADRISTWAFDKTSLRLSPANTLRMEGGRLLPGQGVTYDVTGVEGPPRLLAARWIVDDPGRLGPELSEEEIRSR
jgi:hypothetical protein